MVGDMTMRLAVAVMLCCAASAFAQVPADNLTAPLTDCDAREDYSLCVLKQQRDDALDNVAIARGELARTRAWWKSYLVGAAEKSESRSQGEARMADRRDRLAAWWKAYVEGLPKSYTRR